VPARGPASTADAAAAADFITSRLDIVIARSVVEVPDTPRALPRRGISDGPILLIRLGVERIKGPADVRSD
jgi:hypothetical protein